MDGIDIGKDTETPLGGDYRVPFAFTGMFQNFKVIRYVNGATCMKILR
ncbi:hypothetical protein SAMN04515620_10483 [Collimonas sp. OK607]|nr:hypothetical protein SAMN04515620_10483 [Collimonas sp. OK607]